MKQLLKVVEVLPKRQFDSKTGEKIDVVPMRDVYFYPKSRVSTVFIAETRDCSLIHLFTFTDFHLKMRRPHHHDVHRHFCTKKMLLSSLFTVFS